MSDEYRYYVPYDKLSDYRVKNSPKACPLLKLEGEKFSPVVDHDHKSGRIRGVISLEVNALIGKIENFYGSRCVNSNIPLPDVLRTIADYLESEQGPYHPIGLKQVTRRFSRWTKKQQIDELISLGANASSIDACVNAKQRTALFRKLLVEGRGKR